MTLILELLFSAGRIVLLLFGIVFIFLFANLVYKDLNSFLYAYDSPCIALISLLVALVPTAAFFYGAHIRKYFWQRENHYNWIIFFISYVIGTILTFYPESYIGIFHATGTYCPMHIDFSSKIQQSISTGIVTSLLAYMGMDLGVVVKHLGHTLR